jgi:predicted nucleotide-binding protein
MSNATVQQQQERPTSAKLVATRADAIKHLRTCLDKGGEIKALRIRSGDDLDQGRAFKLEWVQECTDLLNTLFDNSSVADYVNDWVGKVFPEYAEFGNFVEQFYEEMDYRLNKLRMVLKRVEEAPDTSGVFAPSASASSASAAAAPAEDGSVKKSKSSRTHQPASPASPNTESAMPAVNGNKVLFVSHGPKDPSSEAVLQFMQQLSLPVVEADHTNGLIDTLEGRNDMNFVVVMNVVDHVENGKGSLSDNSIFKLGYCAGKLGIKRMCMMHSPNQPQVSDTQGISHVPVDPNGGWQLHLARQMKRSGCDIDLNRLA